MSLRNDNTADMTQDGNASVLLLTELKNYLWVGGRNHFYLRSRWPELLKLE